MLYNSILIVEIEAKVLSMEMQGIRTSNFVKKNGFILISRIIQSLFQHND